MPYPRITRRRTATYRGPGGGFSATRPRRRSGRMSMTRTRRIRGGKRGFGMMHSFTRWTVPTVNAVTTSPTGKYNNGVWTVDTAVVEANLGMDFRIQELANVSEFTNLFDQYRICGVKVSIKMVSNPDAASVANSSNSNLYANYYPTLWYVTDDDDAAPVLVSQLREFARVRHVTMRPNKEVSIFVRPKTLQGIYNGLLTTAYGVGPRKQFLDIANPSIPHYGLKMALDFEGNATSALNPWTFRINAKYYFQTKGVR